MFALVVLLAALGLGFALAVLFWEKSFHDKAIVSDMEHVPERPNEFAEYDAYVTGDDTMLFSYFPEKFILHLEYNGRQYRLNVERREYNAVCVGDEITVFCWQNVVTRRVKPVAIIPDAKKISS